jgi:hypothetical protein
MPDDPRHDAEATARAQADEMGLGVLDAVDVGGTWTVVGESEPAPAAVPAVEEPPEAEPADRRPRRRLLWIGLAAVAAVLLFAALISRAVPGPRPAGAPTPPPVAAPGATDQPGTTAFTPRPTARATHGPGGTVVPAGQPQPTGFTPAPLPSASAAPTPLPSPMPSPLPSPLPTATIGPSAVPINPTSIPVPPPSPLGTG